MNEFETLILVSGVLATIGAYNTRLWGVGLAAGVVLLFAFLSLDN